MYRSIHLFLFYISTKKERVLNPLCKVKVSVSLDVCTTAIAVGAVSFLACLMHFAVNATILGDVDLCVVQCCCLVDLLFDQCECVHGSYS